MRRILISFLAVAMLAACEGGDSITKLERRALVDAIKKEKKVKDVALSEDGRALWVGVVDNVSDRSGYAQYICEVTREVLAGHDNRRVYIRIMDIAYAALKDELRELGSYRCDL